MSRVAGLVIAATLTIGSVWGVTDVTPSAIPVGATTVSLLASAGESSCALNVTGTNGVIYELVAGSLSGGLLSLTLPAPAVAAAGVIGLAQGSRSFAVVVFSVPSVASISPTNFSTAGQLPAVLSLAAGSAPVPFSSGVQVRVVCATTRGRSPAATLAATSNTSVFWYSMSASPAADSLSFSFTQESLPSDAAVCPYVDILASYNGGVHWAAGQGSVPVFYTAPIKAVPIYSSALAAVVWPQTLNNARISMASTLLSAVDSSTYIESAYDSLDVGTGKDLASQAMIKAVTSNQAKLLLMGGGEFKPAVRWLAPQYPSVNFLISSSLWNNLTSWGMPNVRAITGRISEAIFYCGYAAAASSYSGKLGLILTVDHPTSYGIANAFALGARAAAADGVMRAGSGVAVTIQTWMLNEFDALRAELTAADDLLSRGVDVLLAVTDNNDRVRQHVFATANSSVFTLGFYADGRLTQGDRVLLSALYILDKLFIDAVQRTLAGSPFTIGPNDAGLGKGVEISSISPAVPIAAQVAMARRVAVSRLTDETEEVFCGTLVDSAGVTRLNGVTGATPADATPSVVGEGGAHCLSAQGVHAMSWVLPEVKMPPTGVSCPGGPNYGSGSCYVWVPPPIPTLPWYARPAFLPAIIQVLAALQLTFFLLASVFIVAFRDALNFSSPAFLMLVNVGALLYTGALFTYFVPAEASALAGAGCTARLWLEGFGFALMFGALFAKTHRVHRLFNNRRLGRLKLGPAYVLRLLGLALLAEACVLAVLTGVVPSMATVLTDPTASFVFSLCTGPQGGAADPVVVLASLHVALLGWGSYLAFRTRNVSAGFNESLWIGLSIYNVLVCELLGFILGSLQNSVPAMQYYSAMVRLGIPPLLTHLLLFGPKVAAIVKQAEERSEAARAGKSLVPYHDGQDSGSNNSYGSGAVGHSAAASRQGSTVGLGVNVAGGGSAIYAAPDGDLGGGGGSFVMGGERDRRTSARVAPETLIPPRAEPVVVIAGDVSAGTAAGGRGKPTALEGSSSKSTGSAPPIGSP